MGYGQPPLRFVDSIMGVSFFTPVALTYSEKMSDLTGADGWATTYFSGGNISQGTYVQLISKQVKAGSGSVSDHIDYDTLLGQMKDQCSDIQQEAVDIQGYRGVKFIGRMKGFRDLYLNGLLIFRNNKEIMLCNVADGNHLHSPAMDSLFSTFIFIQLPVSNWTWNSSTDSLFTCWAPSPFRKESPAGKLRSLSYDTVTALSYFVMPDTLDRYTRYASDSLFWDAELKQIVGNDSLIEEKDVANGAVKGKELLVRGVASHNFDRIRMLINGDKSFELYLSGSKELLFNANAEKFFRSFRLKEVAGVDYIRSSKMGILLQDLSSADSVIRAKAFQAFRLGISQKEDLPLLRADLFRRFPSPFETGSSTIVNESIADDIAHLQDPLSVTLVKEHYPSLTGKDEELKNTGLSLLALLNTKESFAALAGLWLQSPPNEEVSGVCQIKLEDNLAMTAAIYPVLQKLAGNAIHAPFIASLALRLMDSGYVEKRTVDAAAGDFISTAERLLPLLTTKKEAGGGYELNLVELIGGFKTPAAIGLLKEYLSVKNVALLKKVVLELLKDGQQVSPAAIRRIADDKGIRAEFYADLKKLKKTALFPRQYMTQAAFAEAAIYDASENPEMDSVTIVFIKTKIALFGGKNYSFYLYKVTDYSDGNPYVVLGVAGGYDLAGAKLEALPDLAGVYYDKELDTNNITALLNAYLKKMAGEGSEPAGEGSEPIAP
jgi:hypothetical protein